MNQNTISVHALADLFRRLDEAPPVFGFHPVRAQILLEIGQWLEAHIRPEGYFDLQHISPNPVWELIQNRLLKRLEQIQSFGLSDQPRIWQWYNSGVIICAGHWRLAFDLVPIPRAFGWAEPPGLTEKLADTIDMLFVTHGHPDHFDHRLAQACLRRGKPVYLPESLAENWPHGIQPQFLSLEKESYEERDNISFVSRPGIHVWRDTPEEVPSIYYEVEAPDRLRLIFTGDLDYSRSLSSPAGKVDWLFVTWRSPNARYEPGHPEAIGTPADALRLAVNQVQPAAVILEHYGELEHIYQSYPASLDIAVEQIKAIPGTDCLFWGETAAPPRSASGPG